jgi:iron-sulfur cluster assembly protein
VQITPEAAEAIRAMVEDGEAGGLRISGGVDEDGDTALDFELAAEPVEGDEVIEEAGAVVYLDPVAAEVLADKTLGAHAHGDHMHFSID